MNIARYRHVLAVADAGSFGRAAAALGMSQPPLSQSIRRLERDLGVTLFERTTQHVALTPAGEAFLPEARAAVAAAERAAALARAAGTAPAPLRLGVVSVALFEVLPALLQAAAQASIPVRAVYASTNDQLAGLADGSLDIGLVTPPFDAPARLQVTVVADEPVVAAMPVGSAATPDGPVSLEALGERLILFPRRDGPALHDAILALFRTRGLAPRTIAEAPASMLATLALVAAGVGASLVPAAVARNLTIAGAAFRPLAAEGVPTWTVALAHMPLAARSPAARLLGAWRGAGTGSARPAGAGSSRRD